MLHITDPSPTLSTSEETRRLRQQGVDVIHLGSGKPVLRLPTIVSDAVGEFISSRPLELTDSQGIPNLREELTEQLRQELDINSHPDELVITAGAKGAVMATILALIEPGDEVLLSDPTWIGYEPWIRCAGATPIYFSMGKEQDYRPDWMEIEDKLTARTRLLILSTPHNPTGTVLRADELKTLVAILENYDVTLLSDESNSKVVFAPARHISPATMFELRDRIVVIRSFSKDYGMSGWRIGYVWSQGKTIRQIAAVHQHAVSCVPALVQFAALTLIQWSEHTAFCSKLRKAYRERRDIIVNGLNRIAGIHCHTPEGTWNVFPDISELGSSSRAWAQRLLAEGRVATLPGVDLGPYGEGHLRMTFTETPDRLKAALSRMAGIFCDGTKTISSTRRLE